MPKADILLLKPQQSVMVQLQIGFLPEELFLRFVVLATGHAGRSFCALLNSCLAFLRTWTAPLNSILHQRGKTGKLILFIALQKRAQSGLTHPGF
ncbi:hypothetical protein CEXT_597481 [Caerostris extrusa]|uniref:Uncharacterized protein n=1 Tax=Caerostris extrusa TaxID=172846 RepID=A0AAV4WHD6_CAEEX|nr:hypothetical protein CEXT_597481 [Caerostris extrusa]